MTTWSMGLHSSKKNRMWIDFPYDLLIKNQIKALPGSRWDSDGKVWHFPLDLDIARDIRRIALQHGASLSISKPLADWARLEKARYAAAIQPASNDDMLPVTRQARPDLITAMTKKPWQISGANFIASQKRVLLADQPGLGKTLQTIAAIVENDITGPILVVAPKSAVSVTWPEEIERWLGPDESVWKINGELTPSERKFAIDSVKTHVDFFPGKRAWVLVGPNYLRIRADLDQYGKFKRDAYGKKIIRVVREALPDLFSLQWSAVIVDESHQTLAGGSPGQGKSKWSAQRLGLDALKIDPNGMRIAISGTPFRGKTENLFGTLQWLDNKKYTSYWNWIKRHYGVTDNYSTFGPAVVKGDRILDEKRFFQELQPYMVRRTKAEVEKDLPPKTYGGVPLDASDPNSPVAVWLPMTGPQTTQYNEIMRKAVITIDELGEEVTVNGILAEMVRLKQVANSRLGIGVKPELPSNKVDWIIDFLEERIEAGTKVIIASQFTSFIELLSTELNRKKIGHYVFTGKTNDSERKRIRSAFQGNGGEMVILLNTKSGGVSLTLDAADDVVICDQTWIPDDQEQVEDRAHRISRHHNVTVWNLASLGTIDEDIAAITAARGEAITNILDKQRGMSFAKELVSALKHRVEGQKKTA